METTVRIECFVLIKHEEELDQAEAVAIGLKTIEYGNLFNAEYESAEMEDERRACVTRYFNHITAMPMDAVITGGCLSPCTGLPHNHPDRSDSDGS